MEISRLQNFSRCKTQLCLKEYKRGASLLQALMDVQLPFIQPSETLG